jgi:hypothetical protein
MSMTTMTMTMRGRGREGRRRRRGRRRRMGRRRRKFPNPGGCIGTINQFLLWVCSECSTQFYST